MGRIRKLVGGKGHAAKGRLGEDILDLSPLGGTWQKAVQGVVEKSKRQDVIAFIENGTLAPQGAGPLSQSGMRPSTTMWFWGSLHRVRSSPRLTLGLAAAMGPDQRDRFGKLVQVQSWTVRYVADLNGLARQLPVEAIDKITLVDLERFGEAIGWLPDAILTLVLSPLWYEGRTIGQFDDLDQLVVREVTAITAALTPAKHDHVCIWERLRVTGPEAARNLAAPICDAATANSKALRQAAGPFVAKLPEAQAIAELRNLALQGKPAQRALAVRLGAKIAAKSGDDDFFTWASETLGSDRARGVQEALAAFAGGPQPVDVRPDLPHVEFERIDRVRLTSLSGSRPTRRQAIAILNGEGDYSPSGRDAGRACDLLAREQVIIASLSGSQLARLVVSVAPTLWWSADRIGAALRDVSVPEPLLMSAVAEHDDRPEFDVIQATARLYSVAPGLWTSEQITKWAVYHADALAALVETKVDSHRLDRQGLLALMREATSLPPRLRDTLVAAAVGGYKSDREELYRVVGVEHADEVLPYLNSRKLAERSGAAEWVRFHPTQEAVDALLQAARKEKDDTAKAAMLTALETLGASIEEFFGAATLAREAEKALAKKGAIPTSMEWLDVASLGGLVWRDGSQVETHVIQWFLATAVKGKTAEPSPILRRHFDDMDPAAVRAFGVRLLDFWMAEDLRTVSEAEATAIAHERAPRCYQWGQNGLAPYANMTLKQITDTLYLEARERTAGSATKTKGLLAVVSAAAGSEVADRTLVYIKKHRGHRASQAKVLLQMLAWIDEPATVQVVMSIATRFHPKGIQVEATKQAQLLAERHGWTLEDLADRSIPSGGFEPTGQQLIDYGTRTFTALLADDLSVSLVNNETGKTIRSLPKGRADEDPEIFTDAKKDFSAAKKELKAAAKLQPERLHLAMCTQRSWGTGEYGRYFVDHPVMIRLATRLAWVASNAETTLEFRPLTDGTLVGIDDGEVALDEQATITIAHGQKIGLTVASLWQQHLIDYEVPPLFPQFGRPTVSVADDQTVIEDFVGFMHNDGSLRGQMNRHGWQLGMAQDAGMVYEIVKDVPSSSFKAVVELLGGVPAGVADIGSWDLAFGKLFFVKTTSPYVQVADAVKLRDIPPILLTEIFAETQSMAQAGTGLDLDYKRKVG